jgi:hypothetical protein
MEEQSRIRLRVITGAWLLSNSRRAEEGGSSLILVRTTVGKPWNSESMLFEAGVGHAQADGQ